MNSKTCLSPHTMTVLMTYVQEHFPESHAVCERPNRIDFYPILSGEIPVATIDLLSGKVTRLDRDVVITSQFPAARSLRDPL